MSSGPSNGPDSTAPNHRAVWRAVVIWASLAAMVAASLAIARSVRSEAMAKLAVQPTLGTTLSARLPQGWTVIFDAARNGGPGANADLGMQLIAIHETEDEVLQKVLIQRVPVADGLSGADLIHRAYDGQPAAAAGLMAQAQGTMWEDPRPARVGDFDGSIAQVAFILSRPDGAFANVKWTSVVVAPLGDGTAIFVEIERFEDMEEGRTDLPLVRAIAQTVQLR